MSQKFAFTKLPTPIFNTPDLRTCFGGEQGDALLLNKEGLLRCVETVLFPQTQIELIEKMSQPQIWRIHTHAYPYKGDFFVDERFLDKDSSVHKERNIELPSATAILKTMHSLTGTRYIWGGNWPEGIDQLAEFYPRKTLFKQQDPQVQDLWTLRGVDCSGLLHFATSGWTHRNTSKLVEQGMPVNIEGKNKHEILSALQELDIIVWAGHALYVLDRNTTIESKPSEGVVKFEISERLCQILKERKPVNDWSSSEGPRFVIRRWHPQFLNSAIKLATRPLHPV